MLTYNLSCIFSIHLTFVATTGLARILLNSVATDVGSTLITCNDNNMDDRHACVKVQVLLRNGTYFVNRTISFFNVSIVEFSSLNKTL